MREIIKVKLRSECFIHESIGNRMADNFMNLLKELKITR
jgi:hypothetical protein